MLEMVRPKIDCSLIEPAESSAAWQTESAVCVGSSSCPVNGIRTEFAHRGNGKTDYVLNHDVIIEVLVVIKPLRAENLRSWISAKP